MAEWSKTVDCKSVEVFLRRFKSCLFHLFVVDFKEEKGGLCQRRKAQQLPIGVGISYMNSLCIIEEKTPACFLWYKGTKKTKVMLSARKVRKAFKRNAYTHIITLG